MSSSIPDPVPEGATEAQLRHIINYWRIEAIVAQDRLDGALMVAESGNALVKQLKDQLAAAKAENERLSKLFANTERLMLLDGEFEAAKVGTYAALQAENERLRKAGDAMIEEWWLQLSCPHRMKESWLKEDAIQAWLAAKGVQS